jgi:phosphonate transport system ATP-binding protein
MLEIRDLTRRFSGHVTVDGASLGIPNGQMVRVTGRSGAGKSTLLRMINRLIGRREMAAARAGPAGGKTRSIEFTVFTDVMDLQ